MASKNKDILVVARLKDAMSGPLGKVIKQTGKFRKSMVAAFARIKKAVFSLKGALAGLAAFMATKWAANMIGSAASAGDELAKLAKSLSVSGKSLSEMRYAAEKAGVDISLFKQGVRDLAKSIVAARRGAEDKAEAFRKLGIDVDRIGDKETDLTRVMMKMADGLNAMDNSFDRTNAALRVFGEESGVRLIPMLRQGRQEIAANVAEAQRMGIVWDTAALRAAERFTDAGSKFSAALRGIRNQVAGSLFPAITKVVDRLADYLASNRGLIVKGVVKVSQTVVRILTTMVSTTANVMKRIEPMMRRLGIVPESKAQVDARARVGRIKGQISDIKDVKRGYRQDFENAMGRIADYTGAGREAPGHLIAEANRARDMEAKAHETVLRLKKNLVVAQREYARATRESATDWDAVIRKIQDAGAAMSGLLGQGGATGGEGATGGAGGPLAGLGEKVRGGARAAAGALGDYWDKWTQKAKEYAGAQDEIRAAAESFSQAMQGQFTSIMSQGFSSIIMGASKAKDAFRGMATTILKQISQMIIQLAVLQPLMNALFPGAGFFAGMFTRPGGDGPRTVDFPSMGYGAGATDTGSAHAARPAPGGGTTQHFHINALDAGSFAAFLANPQNRKTLGGAMATVATEDRNVRTAYGL